VQFHPSAPVKTPWSRRGAATRQCGSCVTRRGGDRLAQRRDELRQAFQAIRVRSCRVCPQGRRL